MASAEIWSAHNLQLYNANNLMDVALDLCNQFGCVIIVDNVHYRESARNLSTCLVRVRISHVHKNELSQSPAFTTQTNKQNEHLNWRQKLF